jgi:predicted ATP-dependent endonuclease of OLD family
MYISALRISNFRRLQNVLIDLADDISVLVGSNNSGKTSTAHALQLFLNSKETFSVHDFNSSFWRAMDQFGEGVADVALPRISIDLWFRVEAVDLHRVIDLLPRLQWEGAEVGVRVEFAANEEDGLLERFREARTKARANIKVNPDGTQGYIPPPKTMYEFLSKSLNKEFGLKYYVLDRAQFDGAYIATEGYRPSLMTPENGRGGKEVLNSLVKIEVLNAQRHLSDKSGGGRAEELSRHLGRYYSRNLEKRDEDFEAIQALSESESMLNVHLERVFQPVLNRLSELGYPERPRLVIRTALNPATLMSSGDEGTKVHYVLNPGEEEAITLPDRYNGLGFKNLIYMVVELLDRHAQWMSIEENRPPLHLVFIEEPEVHLHAQLQQVFIRKVLDILKLDDEDALFYKSQFLITTHSPHILYERGFKPIRYFRRSATGVHQSSEVLNLSVFHEATDPEAREFLERYMKLTHCDLFFADAAVLVEGNVERLLMPQMIEKAAEGLKAACLSILEVGGAFGYRFRNLIEFLGLTTLIVTDIDSVMPSPPPPAGQTPDQAAAEAEAEDADDDEDDAGVPKAGSACPVSQADAVTSNQTLIQWLPGCTTIAALLAATPDQRTQPPTAGSAAFVRVAYQGSSSITWRGTTLSLAGRTLEEAFALENLVWCQAPAQKDIQLRIPRNDTKDLAAVAAAIHKRVKGCSFKKTDFALALLTRDPGTWIVPKYIADGLKWLEGAVLPPEPPPAASAGTAAPAPPAAPTAAVAPSAQEAEQ